MCLKSVFISPPLFGSFVRRRTGLYSGAGKLCYPNYAVHVCVCVRGFPLRQEVRRGLHGDISELRSAMMRPAPVTYLYSNTTAHSVNDQPSQDVPDGW